MKLNAIEELVQSTIKEAQANYAAGATKVASATDVRSEATKLASLYERLAKDPAALSKLAEKEPHSGTDDPKVQPPLGKDMTGIANPVYTTPNSPHTDQEGTDTVPETDEDRSTQTPNDIDPVLKQGHRAKIAAALSLVFSAVENGQQPNIQKIATAANLPPEVLRDVMVVLAAEDATAAEDEDEDEDEDEEKAEAEAEAEEEGKEKDAGAENESSVSPTEYAALDDGPTTTTANLFLRDAAAATAFTKRQAVLASNVGPLRGLFDSIDPYKDSVLHEFFNQAESAGVKTTRA